ncbi:hypothetical protein [Acinetobacter sp.]|uniref:hypothetical protein n=1 Tax=Acinetobacter sp. TaxID=472 RepID=UPI00388E46DC
MDHSEQLKSMLQDIINDRSEQAHATMHDYFVSKTREVAGLSAPTVDVTDDDDFDDE